MIAPWRTTARVGAGTCSRFSSRSMRASRSSLAAAIASDDATRTRTARMAESISRATILSKNLVARPEHHDWHHDRQNRLSYAASVLSRSVWARAASQIAREKLVRSAAQSRRLELTRTV